MGLSGAKPVYTPLDPSLRLTSIEYDSHVQGSEVTKSDEPLEDIGKYQRLVGRLIYLTMTRINISFAVQTLSQFMHAPKESYMDAALRVVRYIKSALGLGLFMPSQSTDMLTTYCDSDWGTCLQTRKSVTGYLVKFGNAIVSWKSKKQETVARSSAEAEFRSMASAVAEVTWCIGLYKELGVDIKQPVNLLCDSKAAIQIAANPIFHERTKHFDIDCHFF
ncbi:secreted RxLR effector protein 161-like [Solanum stenotomum]|uniref:secreted RxLR effector protein 161-like n=1 Tax=Solanum stenotomum TaxID=172797 RepID=UPI0020D1616B|nr:secreted RxLR effector protein 161-like [Solanum stenotomum]